MPEIANSLQVFEKNGGDDETRTRDLCRDSERFISTCKHLQEHGRHPKSLQGSLRHCYCVPRCAPRFPRIPNPWTTERPMPWRALFDKSSWWSRKL